MYRGVTLVGIEDWCKIWRKTDLKVELTYRIHFENCLDIPYSHE